MPGYLRAERGAHVLRVGDDADPAEIQSVGIPASADGGVVVVMPVGVPSACVVEQLEVLVRQIEPSAAHLGGELRTAPAVVGVMAIVLSPGVMEEGEQPNDLDDGPGLGDQDTGVALDAPPMIRAMNRVWISTVGLAGHRSPQHFVVYWFHRRYPTLYPRPKQPGTVAYRRRCFA